MRKMKHSMHPKMKMPKMGGGMSGTSMMEGSPDEEAGESATTEASEGGQGFKRGGHVGMRKAGHDGHKGMASSTKHGHRPI